MKLVIASDIHGSATWCERLMQTIEVEKPDTILLLGDLLYHGPRNDLSAGYDPKAVIGLLDRVSDRVVAVRGNCDSEVDQMMFDFDCGADDVELMTPEGVLLYATHGHLFDPFEPAQFPQLPSGSWMFTGHTHRKRNEEVAGIRCVNPGSVGIPRDGSNSCAVWEDGDLRFVLL